MERPFFSLSKKPSSPPSSTALAILGRNHANSQLGMATIWDADILIWASTQITEAINQAWPRAGRFNFTRTTFCTRFADQPAAPITKGFGLLWSDSPIRRCEPIFGPREARRPLHSIGSKAGPTSRSEWRTNGHDDYDTRLALRRRRGAGGVLTIHQDYFLLTGGIERWLYRVVRKHAGKQMTGWNFTMEQLHEKSGSTARVSDFAVDVRKVVTANTMPEYDLRILRTDEGEECVYFTHLSTLPDGHPRLSRSQRFVATNGPAGSDEPRPS